MPRPAEDLSEPRPGLNGRADGAVHHTFGDDPMPTRVVPGPADGPEQSRQHLPVSHDDPDDVQGTYELDLGTFLRSRRERVSPLTAGLPAGGRRRTPGLRREELALLAGISVDYLTRLEQGRERNPSAEVLDSLGRALHLEPEEWLHVKQLSRASNTVGPCGQSFPEPGPLADTTLRLLDQLHPTPAFVLEENGDINAWNPAFGSLMRATGLFELEPPNLLRYTFLSPQARSVFVDWEEVARSQVSDLRAVAAWRQGSPVFPSLVGELSMASPDFASMWAAYEVGSPAQGRRRLDHPDVGELAVDFEELDLRGCTQRRLVTYLPADEASARAIDQLAGA